MSDPSERWFERAWTAERPVLRGLVTAVLEVEPSADALRRLACGAAALVEPGGGVALDAASTERALALVRWGLKQSEPEQKWDAIHALAELALPALRKDLLALFDDKKAGPSHRARAVEALVDLLEKGEALPRLDALRTGDPSWTVRRVAADCERLVHKGETLRGDLFGRQKAMLRAGRIRIEADADRLEPAALAALGLRVPAVYLAFLAKVFAGGRLLFLEEEDPKGKAEPKDAGGFFLTAPERLGKAPRRTPDDLKNTNEYVWTRYVEGARRYPKVDEDYGLRRYAEFYDEHARLDAEAWSYGVLLYERAFGDEAARERYLLRARDVLTTFRDLGGDAWDVVDDRLEDAAQMCADDGLSWPLRDAPQAPLVIGTWEGVVELQLDLEGQGVFARDADEGHTWRVAPSLGAFLNDPNVRPPGASVANTADPLGALAEVGRMLERGQQKEAARAFADVLEGDRSDPVLDAAAAILQRPDMSPTLAGQLLATIPLAGDRDSLEAVKAVLQALPVDYARQAVEALAPFDEDGSQAALFIDAAAGLRKRSHAEVKALAKQIRDGRGSSHLRTLRNPFYKDFKKK